MTLTVKEKDHWRNRIERRIDRKIKEIQASEPAHVWEEMARQAKQMALEDLRIAALVQESKRLEKQIEELKRDERRVWAQTAAVVRGLDIAKIDLPTSFPYDVRDEVNKRKELFLEKLRAEHPKGQQIQRLEQEKEELLDTVWLATSASQIKELWSQIAEGLQSELTPFQQKALAIEPVSAIPSDE